jgi:nucleoid-associated protein YgaU
MPARPAQLRALAVLLTPVALVALAPAPTTALTAVSAPSPDPTAPLLAAVAVAAWTCSAWLALLVLVTGLGRLPGAAGRSCRRAARRLAPAAVRSLLRVAVGTTVAASVVSGSAAWADGTGGLDWPTTPAAVQPHGAHPGLAQQHPTALPTALPPAPAHRPAAAAPRPLRAVPATGGAVVVQPGDSLWAIAARQLGPQATDRRVAQAWPQWWSANRTVVGDHPELIHPGTRLTPPTHR